MKVRGMKLCTRCRIGLSVNAIRRYKWRAMPLVLQRKENDHPVRHSSVVGACVDIGIIDTVEYINREICPTMFSCQGGPFWDAPDTVVPPSVTVPATGWPQLRMWLESRGFTLGYAEEYEHPEHGRAIKRPAGKDVNVWVVEDRVHVDFKFDHSEVFV